MHTKEAIRADLIKFAGKCKGIICIDDVRGSDASPGIMEAIDGFCSEYGKSHYLSPDNFRETYIF